MHENLRPRRLVEPSPSGFTLVELLVVIAIIGVLVALLLPAVQAAREAARRAQCTNNLKQIGLAVHNFHDARKGFPRTRLVCFHGTWATELWPYLEEQSVADQWDPVKGFFYQSFKAVESQVSIYYCPSRRGPPQLSQLNQETNRAPAGMRGGLADYIPCSGDGIQQYRDSYPSGANGVFVAWNDVNAGCGNVAGSPDLWFNGERFYTTFKSIPDGTSKTLLIGEKQVPMRGWGYYQIPSTGEFAHDNCAYNPDNFETVARYAGPNYGLARSPEEAVALNFGGPHSGICQFVFADGSVHALSVEIDEEVLGYLASRNDGKMLKDTDIY